MHFRSFSADLLPERNRTRDDRAKTISGKMVTILVCLALTDYLAMSSPRAYRFLYGWKVLSFLAFADELYLETQESVGASKIMNHESTPLRMRAFRVINYHDGIYSKWIVI